MPPALHRKATYHLARDGLEAETSTLRSPDNFLSALDLGPEASRLPRCGRAVELLSWAAGAHCLPDTAVRKKPPVERLTVPMATALLCLGRWVRGAGKGWRTGGCCLVRSLPWFSCDQPCTPWPACWWDGQLPRPFRTCSGTSMPLSWTSPSGDVLGVTFHGDPVHQL